MYGKLVSIAWGYTFCDVIIFCVDMQIDLKLGDRHQLKYNLELCPDVDATYNATL